MKKGFEKLSLTPWIAKSVYQLEVLAIVALAIFFCRAGYPAWLVVIIALVLLVVFRLWYEWIVAIFAIAENTRQCAVHAEAFNPKDVGEAMGKMLKSLTKIQTEQVSKAELSKIQSGQLTVAKLLAGIREDILAQQIGALNGDSKIGCLCPYCGAEILLPGWIQDGRRVSCVSCGKKFEYASEKSE